MTTIPASTRTTKVTLATATAGPFDIDFRIVASDSVRVWVNGVERFDWDIEPGVITDFTDDAAITFTAPLEAGDVLDIAGYFPVMRGTDYLNGDPGLIRRLNLELAHLWAVHQENRRDADRAIKVPLGHSSMLVPKPGSFLAWDGFGEQIVSKSPASIASALGGTLGAGTVYPTLLDAINNETLTVGETIGTLGYYGRGDKGGWFYDVMPAGTDVGYGDHLTVGGLVLVLNRSNEFVAERYGAVVGEVSAQLQAAWNDMILWQLAQDDPETPVRFSFNSRCTLANQVMFNGLGGTRAPNVDIDMSLGKLLAVPGGDLSPTQFMLLIRLNGGVQFWGTLDGGRFAGAYDFFGAGSARGFSPVALHFKGCGFRVRGGGNGALALFGPRAVEYQPSDPEFNTQSNFTARGFSVEDGDFSVYNANILFCGVGVYFDTDTVQVEFVYAHIVGGNPNWQTTGAPFVNMVLVANYATRENHMSLCYFDNGVVDDYENTLNILGGHYVDNGASTLTEPKIRQYPQVANQTVMNDVCIRGLSGSASIGLVNLGAFTWAGNIAGQAAYFAAMSAKNTEVAFRRAQVNVYPSNADIIEYHIKTQGKFTLLFDSGANVTTLEVDPANNTIRSSGSLLAQGGGMGFGDGAAAVLVGSAQATRTDPVTMNGPTGRIPWPSAAGTATWQTFVFNNASLGLDDTITFTQKGGSNTYQFVARKAVGAGSCTVAFAAVIGTATDNPTIDFTICRGDT